MKSREGFVSNSSSTSFIIAVSEGKPCPHCGRRGRTCEDIHKIIENSRESETEFVAETKGEIIKQLDEWWIDNETKNEIYKNMNENENCEFMMFDISYHEATYVKENIFDNENVKVIYEVND